MCMLTSCCYYKYRKYGNRNVVLFIIKQNIFISNILSIGSYKLKPACQEVVFATLCHAKNDPPGKEYPARGFFWGTDRD